MAPCNAKNRSKSASGASQAPVNNSHWHRKYGGKSLDLFNRVTKRQEAGSSARPPRNPYDIDDIAGASINPLFAKYPRPTTGGKSLPLILHLDAEKAKKAKVAVLPLIAATAHLNAYRRSLNNADPARDRRAFFQLLEDGQIAHKELQANAPPFATHEEQDIFDEAEGGWYNAVRLCDIAYTRHRRPIEERVDSAVTEWDLSSSSLESSSSSNSELSQRT